MDQWLSDQSKQVEREVVSMEWEGKDARAVVMRRKYPTDINDLWDAIVDPERLKRWFLPVSGELRQGGKYQLEGNAGGTITRCEEPTFLAVTWESQGGVGWVNVRLTAIDDSKTQLTLEHIAHEDAGFLEFWNQYGPGAVGVGWDLGLLGLAQYLETGSNAFNGDEDAWTRTEDGRHYVSVLCDDWVAADTQFGTPVNTAQEAGEQTVAFYTGAS